jgi:hypothetical protein
MIRKIAMLRSFMKSSTTSYRIVKQRKNALRALAHQTGCGVGMDFVDPPVGGVGLAPAIALSLTAAQATAVDIVVDRSFAPG